MKVIYILIMLTLCTQIGACEVNTKQDLSIYDGKRGIIGDINLRFADRSDYVNLRPSISNIAVYKLDGSLASRGVGTLISTSGNAPKCWILTAKHVLIDPKTNELHGLALYFGSTEDQFTPIRQKLKLSDIQSNHDIAIIDTSCSNRPSINVNRHGSLRNKLFDEAVDPVHEFIFITTHPYGETSEELYLIQSDITVEDFTDHLPNIYRSDIDAVNGMSGSPVFAKTNDVTYIFGVTSKVRKIGSCNEFHLLNCYTSIESFDFNDFKFISFSEQ